jgi:3-hydroxypropanoate dehydrogenase
VIAEKLARTVNDDALRSIFLEARSAHAFLDHSVDRTLLLRIAELAALGPTSSNTLPMRIVFVDTKEGKQRLLPAVSPGNVEQTTQAPVTAIFAADMHFHEHFARIAPENSARLLQRWDGDPPNSEAARQFSWDQALLQIGYFTLAARALGLDCGPMGGFQRGAVDAEFFPDGRRRSQFLMNLGFGDDRVLKPRAPRLELTDFTSFA